MSTKTRVRTIAPCRGLYATGATTPVARYHTQRHSSLQADRRTFVLLLTPEQREAKHQRETIEIARMRNETKVGGLILPIGAEW